MHEMRLGFLYLRKDDILGAGIHFDAALILLNSVSSRNPPLSPVEAKLLSAMLDVAIEPLRFIPQTSAKMGQARETLDRLERLSIPRD